MAALVGAAWATLIRRIWPPAPSFSISSRWIALPATHTELQGRYDAMASPTIAVLGLLVLVAACPSSGRRLHDITDAVAAAGTTIPVTISATGTSVTMPASNAVADSVGSSTLLSTLASRSGFTNAHEPTPTIADTLTHLVAATATGTAASDVAPFATPTAISGSALPSTTGAVEPGSVTRPQLAMDASIPDGPVGGAALTQALAQLLTGTSSAPATLLPTTSAASSAPHSPVPLLAHSLPEEPVFQLSDR